MKTGRLSKGYTGNIYVRVAEQMMEKELLKLFRHIYPDINIDAYVKPKSKRLLQRLEA